MMLGEKQRKSGRLSNLRCLAEKAAICSLLCTLSVPAFGVAITDVSDPNYVTGDSNYTGVTEILFDYIGRPGTFLCTGSLVSDYQILTAGHCASGAENWTVTFQTPSGTTNIGVTQALVHPDFGPRPAPYGVLDQYDVAILTLAAMAPSDAFRYLLATTFEGAFSVSPIDIVGYGYGGSAATGVEPLGVRRHAVNTIDALYPFPDSPFQMNMMFGAEPGNYGLISGGDSGSPAFFNGRIIGVGSFTNLPSFGGYFTSITYSTGHTNLLDPTTGIWVANALIPEPGTVGLLAAGLAGLAFLRKLRIISACVCSGFRVRRIGMDGPSCVAAEAPGDEPPSASAAPPIPSAPVWQ